MAERICNESVVTCHSEPMWQVTSMQKLLPMFPHMYIGLLVQKICSSLEKVCHSSLISFEKVYNNVYIRLKKCIKLYVIRLEKCIFAFGIIRPYYA